MDRPLRNKIRRRLRMLASAAGLRRDDGSGSPDTSQAQGCSIQLEYPLNPVPRHGYGSPAHPELERLLLAGADRYREQLRAFLPYVDALHAIPLTEESPTQPWWHNGWFGGLDAVALYCFLATRNPARYIEIGSGNSTKFARRAISDHGLRTEVISIDPQPRAEVDSICDRTIRAALEDTDLSVFSGLGDGDILFLDGSHRCFMNSDVTVAFTELLPRLAPGVLVHVHDIFLPWDYPPYIADWYYSEHYLMACWLLAGGPRIEVTMPNFFISITPEIHRIYDPLWGRFTWSNTGTNGTGFWFTMR